MNEKKKLYVIIALVVLLFVIIPVLVVLKNVESERMYKAFESTFASKNNEVVYLGRPTCSHCQNFRPKLDRLAGSYGFDYLYVNTDNLNSDMLDKVLEKLGVDPSKFGTPYTVVVKDNKVVAEQSGEVSKEEDLFNFFQKNGIISSEAEYDGESEKTSLTYIEYDKFASLVAGTDKSVIVIGLTYCGYCAQARPILSTIVDEEDIAINYIEYDTLASDKQTAIIDLLKTEEVKTPLLLIVQNGKVLNKYEGARTKTDYLNILKENGVIQ